mgnify:CR=1 FL=1
MQKAERAVDAGCSNEIIGLIYLTFCCDLELIGGVGSQANELPVVIMQFGFI